MTLNILKFFTYPVTEVTPADCCTTWEGTGKCYTEAGANNNNHACQSTSADPCNADCASDATTDACKNCCQTTVHDTPWNCGKTFFYCPLIC